MIRFNKCFTCDVCGKTITPPHFRIEWGRTPKDISMLSQPMSFIQVCHNKCSYGISIQAGSNVTSGDIIYDQLSLSPQQTDDELTKLSKQYPNLSQRIESIRSKILVFEP